jgi:hypothetical protein
MRAGGRGIPALVTPARVGTEVADGEVSKEWVGTSRLACQASADIAYRGVRPAIRARCNESQLLAIKGADALVRSPPSVVFCPMVMPTGGIVSGCHAAAAIWRPTAAAVSNALPSAGAAN